MPLGGRVEAPTLRVATLGDASALQALIAQSARALCRAWYPSEQIEAALGSAFGLDTELVRDATYFVVEAEGRPIGCGGWSRRKTLFGADGRVDREPQLLDPAVDAARIRAFFVHPDWARRGIGRLVLQRCEDEALLAGFRRAALVATLSGEPLYRAAGFVAEARIRHPLPGGLVIEFVPMHKDLV